MTMTKPTKFTFNNVFGSELDISVGQFQVSDPLFKRELRLPFEDYQVYSIEEFTSLFTPDNYPGLNAFILVIIGLSVVVGFLVVFLALYTAVLERTREIGILKSLGASPGYILGVLLRETGLLALVGSVYTYT